MAVTAAARLLNGVASELSRESVEKLGSQLYPQTNAPLNTGPGAAGEKRATGSVNVQGDDDGEFTSDGASDDANWDKERRRGSTRSGNATSPRGNATAPPPAEAAEPDGSYPIKQGGPEERDPGFGRSKDKGKTKAHIIARAKALGATGILPKGWTVSKSTIDDDEGRGPCGDPRGADSEGGRDVGDLSGVPAEARPFYEAQIRKADEATAEAQSLREDLQKAADKTNQLAETLREREFIAKAETEMPVVGPSSDVAKILKDAQDHFDKETYGKLESLLKAANERIATGDLFAELGRTGHGQVAKTGSAYAEAESKAAEIVSKKRGEDHEGQGTRPRVRAEPGAVRPVPGGEQPAVDDEPR